MKTTRVAISIACAVLWLGCQADTAAPHVAEELSAQPPLGADEQAEAPVERNNPTPAIEIPGLDLEIHRIDPNQAAEEPPVREEPPVVEEPPRVEPETVDPSTGQLGDGQAVDLLPPPPEDASRARRRMDIDQLEATLVQTTGQNWTDNNGNSQFTELSRTLGKPDYIDLTSEDLEPAALFQKFLDDAARDACFKAAAAEADTVTLDPPVLMVYAKKTDTLATASQKIEKNLAYLLLRFHGKHVTSESPEMDSWRWLYQSAELVSGDPALAWRTVCVGLVTHPNFYTY